jgi:hypothetical protein
MQVGFSSENHKEISNRHVFDFIFFQPITSDLTCVLSYHCRPDFVEALVAEI